MNEDRPTHVCRFQWCKDCTQMRRGHGAHISSMTVACGVWNMRFLHCAMQLYGKRCKIRRKLVLFTNTKSHALFHLIIIIITHLYSAFRSEDTEALAVLMTLNDLERQQRPETHRSGAHCVSYLACSRDSPRASRILSAIAEFLVFTDYLFGC